MNLKLLKQKLVKAVIIGGILSCLVEMNVQATEISNVIRAYESIDGEKLMSEYLSTISEENLNRGFADMTAYTLIRSQPNNDSAWVGKLYPGNVVTVGDITPEWTQIISGNVIGYVRTEYIVIGEEASKRIEDIQQTKIIVDVHTLNVRTGPSTDYEITGKVHQGMEIEVTGAKENDWYLIDTPEGDRYVCGQYVKEEKEYTFAESKQEEEERIAYAKWLEEEEIRIAKEEEEAKARAKEIAEGKIVEGSQAGKDVVEYAKQFIGNPYVWGGTDLVNGADCSGFVQSIYKKFGVQLPRTSSEQRKAGVSVSYSEVQPGDIVCYSGHVGIYMGDGKIVNAINSKKGIGILSATYDKILSVRRVI